MSSRSDPQTVHRPRDVELVHSVDDDGGSGEEEEEQKEEDVEEDAAEPPTRSAHRQVFPGDRRNNEPQFRNHLAGPTTHYFPLTRLYCMY